MHNMPKQYAGAEIFAKRRKRSEKWVVDQEQPQTPVTPKTPVYPEKSVSYSKSYSFILIINLLYICRIIIVYLLHNSFLIKSSQSKYIIHFHFFLSLKIKNITIIIES